MTLRHGVSFHRIPPVATIAHAAETIVRDFRIDAAKANRIPEGASPGVACGASGTKARNVPIERSALSAWTALSETTALAVPIEASGETDRTVPNVRSSSTGRNALSDRSVRNVANARIVRSVVKGWNLTIAGNLTITRVLRSEVKASRHRWSRALLRNPNGCLEPSNRWRSGRHP